MPYAPDRPLASLFPVEETRAVAIEITRAAGEFYYGQVRELTPEYKGPADDDERGGRKPGTARDSIRLGPVVELGAATFSITAWSDDPVMEYIEWDTVAHWIPPADGGVLRWPVAMGEFAFSSTPVWHPGTTGKHMFEIAATALDAELAAIAGPVLAAWEVGGVEGLAVAA